MFEYGIGVQHNIQSAFECLKGASIRGNVYAQGNLAVHYYRRKLFNKAADVSKRFVCILENIIENIIRFELINSVDDDASYKCTYLLLTYLINDFTFP